MQSTTETINQGTSKSVKYQQSLDDVAKELIKLQDLLQACYESGQISSAQLDEQRHLIAKVIKLLGILPENQAQFESAMAMLAKFLRKSSSSEKLSAAEQRQISAAADAAVGPSPLSPEAAQKQQDWQAKKKAYERAERAQLRAAKGGQENITDGKVFEQSTVNEIFHVADDLRSALVSPGDVVKSTYDQVTRYDIVCKIIERKISVETLYNISKGIAARADVLELGPANSQLTWQSLAMLALFHYQYFIPHDRIDKMCGKIPVLRSSNQTRYMIDSAEVMLPIYLQIAREIAAAELISCDDSPTRVLETARRIKKGEDEDDPQKLGKLAAGVFAIFGRSALLRQPKKGGRKHASQTNHTVLIGWQSSEGQVSVQYLFRTHLGAAGNLLDKLVQLRAKDAGDLIIHGDMAGSNHLSSAATAALGFNNEAGPQLSHAGCAAHARRPFKRFLNLDNELCLYMLGGFRLIFGLNARAKTCADKERLRRLNKAQRRIWQSLHAKASAVVSSSEEVMIATPGKSWPPSSQLYKAFKYLLNHYDALTMYLDNPLIPLDNNRCERLLRAEVLFLKNSLFRQSEEGRIACDIWRTILMNCQIAGVEIPEYLEYVYRHKEQLKSEPERFTPTAAAQYFKANPERRYPHPRLQEFMAQMSQMALCG